MIVKAYYEGGRVDIFDTDHMTETLPHRGNRLTNYSVDLCDTKTGCIWLSAYYYEARETYRETVGPKELPVARRRDGWSFLLVDGEEIKTLLRMTLDGETVLTRVAGELVDVTALRWAYNIAADIAPMATKAHAHLAGMLAKEPHCDIEAESCKRMGFSKEAFDAISKLELAKENALARSPRELF